MCVCVEQCVTGRGMGICVYVWSNVSLVEVWVYVCMCVHACEYLYWWRCVLLILGG